MEPSHVLKMLSQMMTAAEYIFQSGMVVYLLVLGQFTAL